MIPAAERGQAVAAYLNGASLNSIGRFFGVTRKTVAGWVWDAGHELRPARGAERFQWKDAETRRRAVRAYLDGASATEVGRRFGVNPYTVGRWVKAAGHVMRPRRSPHERNGETRRLAVEAYLAGERTKAVAERFGVIPCTVVRWVKAAGHGMRPRRQPHEKDAETRRLAVEAYLGGDSLKMVARRFGVNQSTVNKWVHSAGHKTRPPGFLNKIDSALRREAVSAYLGGATLREAGQRVGVRPDRVSKWVKAAGHEMRRNSKLNKFSHETRRRAVAAYLAGESAEALAKRHGVSAGVVSRWIRAAGHSLRGSLDRSKFSAATRKLAVEDHLAGESLKAVAERFGANRGTISAWVHAAGHEVRAVDQHKLSKEDRQQAVQSYLDGASSEEVGKRFGVDRTTVADWVKAAGHRMRPAVRRKARPRIRSGTVAPEAPKAQYG